MDEWKCNPHDGKLKEHNKIQHNNQVSLDIIRTLNKRKTSNWFQLENPIKVDFIYEYWKRDLSYHKNDKGIKYKIANITKRFSEWKTTQKTKH